jgi:hypothetical protein
MEVLLVVQSIGVSEFSRILLAVLIVLPIIVKVLIPDAFYSRSIFVIYAICSLVYIALLVLTAPFLVSLKLEVDEANSQANSH